MDRTLLPNGNQEVSACALDYFSMFVHHKDVCLVYVTGRDLSLVEEAIEEYHLPTPDYAITDVGTQIYQRKHDQWFSLDTWETEIQRDWHGKTHRDLEALFKDISLLKLQPKHKQNTYKLSYEIDLKEDINLLLALMNKRLDDLAIQASLVWSIDEMTNTGLLDVLPRYATKLHAIEFLMSHKGYTLNEVVFSGDSGNDLAVMSSAIPSVLVANASEEVRGLALEHAKTEHNTDTLYFANGSYLGMNGNYSAGILEGVWHFMPSMRTALEKIQLVGKEYDK